MFRPKLLFFFLLFNSCAHKQTLSPKQQVLALKEMSDLATVEYVVTKIIKASDNKTWYKLGERKILMSCQATLTAGIDLSKITEKDIDIEGKTIALILPHAKLIALNILPEDIKTEYEDVTVFRSAFTSAERDALAAQGERNIKSSVESLAILQTAEVNATLVFTNFLRRLGYEKVNIRFDGLPAKHLQ
ncbi:MAG: DUF4230 domain-containing protein [Ginsengibacter sp.]